jgi:hypothetical protein
VTDPHSSAAPGTAAPPPPPGQREASPQPARGRRWWPSRETRSTPERPCLNCGDATVGMFCPRCGQRKVDVRISLRRMLGEVMDDQLSLNSTLPRTLFALLFRPGCLTREYVQGRIMRYIPPFRLYLVSSLLFFIILPFVADPGTISINAAGEGSTDSAQVARIADSVLLAHARATGEDTLPLARAVTRTRSLPPAGNIQFGPKPEQVPGVLKPLAERMKRTETRLNAMPRSEAVRTLLAAFEENAPVGVFVMMPLFAMILKMLYARRKRFYVEHFVFALHTHAFAFLVGTAVLLVNNDAVEAAIFVWCMIYLFLALKTVYGQGIVRTFLKFVALGVSYTFLLIFGVSATVLMTALSL